MGTIKWDWQEEIKKILECFLHKPSVIYILNSKASALVTINYVWNSEEDKACIGKEVSLVSLETCVTLIYVLGTHETRIIKALFTPTGIVDKEFLVP